MPRSVYKAPWYRRALPWLFAGLFAVLAPILVFYTAGYRLNPKKVTIERNGTLIADSVPNGARILMNGESIRRVTPTTIQNVAPGPYAVRFEQDGYLSWERTLDIRAEQVTFADRVRLWKLGDAALVSEGRFLALEAEPGHAFAAALVASSTVAEVRFIRDGVLENRFTPSGLSTTIVPMLTWNRAGNGLLIDYERSEQGRDAWVSNDVLGPSHGSLQAADYVWDGSLLVSQDDGMRVVIDPRRETLERERLPAGLVAESDAFDLMVNTSTGEMLVRPRSVLRRVYALPSGTWTLGDSEGPYAMLRNEQRWLAIKPNGEPESGTAEGKRLRWNTEGRNPRAILVHGNELWLWTPGQEPQLLMRQSESFVDAVWHRDGFHVFAATEHRVFVLELDDRGGYATTDIVTDFERINAFAYVGDSIYVAGRKGGVDGLYRRIIE